MWNEPEQEWKTLINTNILNFINLEDVPSTYSGYGNKILAVNNTEDGIWFIDNDLGTSGYSGYSGVDGTIGIDGTSGYSGYSGVDGTIGIDGTSGYSGYSGVVGDGTFTDLTDVPDTYSGHSGKVVYVNSTENGLTFDVIHTQNTDYKLDDYTQTIVITG